MSRIPPLNIDELPPEQRSALRDAEGLLGFISNDALILARNPSVMDALRDMALAVYAPGAVDSGLKHMIGLVSSAAAGCQYCEGHTVFTSLRDGVDKEKLAAIWEFESSDLFTESERAALRIGFLAGQTPNAVTDKSWAEFAEHFDEEAQLEIVSVIAMFGFLNRMNSTLATDLESAPCAALKSLGSARKS